MEDLIGFLPAILLVGFWIFFMFRMKKFNKTNNFGSKQDETISLLKEIRDELKDLNKNNSDKKL